MNVRVIGSVARDLLGKAQFAEVWGETRRGTFLRLDCGWIVFLSNEPEHGPLTLNVDDTGSLLPPPFLVFEMGSAVICGGRRGPLFDLDSARVWSVPPRPARTLPVEQRREFLEQVLRQGQLIRQVPSLEALQAVLSGSGQGGVPPGGEAGRFFPHLAQILRQPVARLDPRSLAGLLGLGSGLTPSGDDIVLGLLLALNRWGNLLRPDLDLPALNRMVLELAYARTTTLSANLIECATLGQADERLVTALDGIMTGAPRGETCAALLAGWGSSSGLDALCGMAIIL